mmetsp:Transcript_4585/g.16054  ORF Transcript_4585/g.16054 Transcript_4585/m.16054 type:complete len:283 (+) Transcript_4585:1653-2501(+)
MDCLRKRNPSVPNVQAGGEAQTAHEAGAEVADDVTIKVWHHEHVELARVLDQLHAAVVDDLLLKDDLGILGGNLPATLQEETVRLLHDVGLVDRRHLLPSILPRVLEGILRDPRARLLRDDLEGLHDAGNDLVLKARVLALRVLSNRHQVDVVVFRFVARDAHTRPDVRVQTELLPQGEVKAPVPFSNWRGHWTLQTHAVLQQRVQRRPRHHTVCLRIDVLGREVVLLPLQGHARGLENQAHALRDLGPDAVARQEGRDGGRRHGGAIRPHLPHTEALQQRP